jgi:hypothetical protein
MLISKYDDSASGELTTATGREDLYADTSLGVEK